MNRLEDSFEGRESLDLTSVIAEFPHNDDHPGQIPVKKLSQAFDSCVTKSDNNDEFMKVFLRVRPVSNKSESTITVESETSIVTSAPESSKRAVYTKTESRHYMFTRVFDAHSQQNEVFEHSTAPMLKKFLDGDNCVMFAYGMTNAGKTYTIQGSSQNPGILPRLVSAILDHTSYHPEFELHASMLEIYQDTIFDLLGKRREKLAIRDGCGKVEVAKLSYHLISSTEDAFKLMDNAAAKRSKSSTLLNTGSSRSHAVYTLTLTRPTSDGGVVSNQFQLVDLAGAERGNRTKATAAQQKEANNINTSLMQLWRCLQCLKKKNSSAMEIIPFRESKLTHMLMPILSRAGLGGVTMIACVNPQTDDYDETISILGNASIASKIREFADMGRVASQIVIPSAAANNNPGPTVSTKVIKLEDLKDYKDKQQLDTSAVSAAGHKRKRHDSTLSAKPGLSKKATQQGSIKTVSITIPDNEISVSARSSLSEDTVHPDEDSGLVESERKRLRVEIADLKDANEYLIQQNVIREAEIRQEVCTEMMQRSQELLSQIQTLQQQLAEQKNQQLNDVTKSCKKVRKNQLLQAQESMSSDLKEAEEELDRMKSIYETNLSHLTHENKQLKQELLKYNPGFVSALGSAASASHQRMTSSVNTTNNLSPSSSSIAQEFSQRMQRDGRFQKKSEEGGGGGGVTFLSVDTENTGDAGVAKKSPQRSPLSPVSKNASNSPTNSPNHPVTSSSKPSMINLMAMVNQNSTHDVSKKENVTLNTKLIGGSSKTNHQQASPQRVRAVDTTTASTKSQPQPTTAQQTQSSNYFTRLRSNLIRM